MVIFIPSHLDPGSSLVVGDFQSSDEDLAVPYPENLKSFFKNWCFCHPVKDLANNIIKISLWPVFSLFWLLPAYSPNYYVVQKCVKTVLNILIFLETLKKCQMFSPFRKTLHAKQDVAIHFRRLEVRPFSLNRNSEEYNSNNLFVEEIPCRYIHNKVTSIYTT